MLLVSYSSIVTVLGTSKEYLNGLSSGLSKITQALECYISF